MTELEQTDKTQCGRCAFCVASCPVFAATGRQAWGPRARLYALRELELGGQRANDSFSQAIFKCTMCGRCEEICPSNLDIQNRLSQGRESLARAGLAPRELKAAVNSITASGNPLGQARDKRTEWLPRGQSTPDKAALVWWVGCLGAYQDIKIGPAILKILKASGQDFTLLGAEEDCCGYLAHLAGDKAAFENLARTNSAKLAGTGCQEVITGCAGCALTLGPLYHEAGFEPPSTEHLVVWLDRLIQEGRLSFTADAKPLKVAWHDPCDLGRGQGIYEPPRRILAALPGIEMIEFPANRAGADCCGGGGGLKAVEPELGLKIGQARVEQAVLAGAEAIVSACPSCKRNLTQAARLLRKQQGGPKIKVLDITEVAAARLA